MFENPESILTVAKGWLYSSHSLRIALQAFCNGLWRATMFKFRLDKLIDKEEKQMPSTGKLQVGLHQVQQYVSSNQLSCYIYTCNYLQFWNVYRHDTYSFSKHWLIQLRLTARWALLLLLCAVRQVFSLTEQPGSSLMRYFPYIMYVAKTLKKFGVGWDETFLPLGCAHDHRISN